MKGKEIIEYVKLIVINDKEDPIISNYYVLMVFKISGLLILGYCIYYWIYNFFILFQFEPLMHTTYITLILISLTCLFEFKSLLLNTISSMTFFGFINITIGMFLVPNDPVMFIVGPIAHGLIALFQLFILLNRKIEISSKYLLWGFIFYIIFFSSYDNFQRWNQLIGIQDSAMNLFTQVYSFYALLISSIIIYFFKKRTNSLNS